MGPGLKKISYKRDVLWTVLEGNVCSVPGRHAWNGDAHETNLKTSPDSHVPCSVKSWNSSQRQE